MKKSLFALALGGFGIGMTEFSIMGLLPNVAEHMGVTIPEAGHVISAYALGVVVGAPVLTAMSGKHSPKSILLFLMMMFTVFNGVSALAPDFTFLLIFRFLAGLPHGAFFGVGAVVASRLAEKGKEGAAVSSMFAGLTIANVIGVPLSTYIGYHFGWRISFGMVAVVGLATIATLQAWIPTLAPNPDSSFLRDLKIFKNLNLWLSIAITSIGFGGFFAWISYIAPFFTIQTGFSEAAIPLLMVIAGLGMTVGIIWGGKLADRLSPLKAILMLMSGMILVLALNAICSHSMFLIVPLTFLTGVIAMAQCPAIQVLLIQNSGEAEMLGASLGQSSFNIGNSLGAFFGGIPLAMGYSYASPQWVGAIMSLVGVLIALYLAKRMKATAIYSQ